MKRTDRSITFFKSGFLTKGPILAARDRRKPFGTVDSLSSSKYTAST